MWYLGSCQLISKIKKPTTTTTKNMRPAYCTAHWYCQLFPHRHNGHVDFLTVRPVMWKCPFWVQHHCGKHKLTLRRPSQRTATFENRITCTRLPRAAAQICTEYDPWRSSNWIVSLFMNCRCISIPTARKSLAHGAEFPQDRRNPNSIWPSIITSRLEKHVGSNWILSFCTWYEGTASKPLYPVTVHKFFRLYWCALSIFLIRKKGAIKIHEGYVCVGHRAAEMNAILVNPGWNSSKSEMHATGALSVCVQWEEEAFYFFLAGLRFASYCESVHVYETWIEMIEKYTEFAMEAGLLHL